MTREDRAAKIAAAAPRDRRNGKWVALAVVLLVVVAGIGIAVYRGTRDQAPTTVSAIPKGGRADGEGLDPYPNVAKAAGAPKVDVYTDVQCPICSQFEKANGAAVDAAAKAGKIALLQHTMTFIERNVGNDSSTRGANATFCAADQGLRDEFTTQLFARQPAKEGDGYTDDVFTQAAQAAGLTGAKLTAFTSCVQNHTYDDYVKLTDDRSSRAGIPGTPTIVINGHKLTGDGDSAADWRALVQEPNSFDRVLATYAK